jgi:hypothetical protein
MPADVRVWAEGELGSPVVEAHDQIGGMSPGCATRLVGADGQCAFVKAVGLELNPMTPLLFRREVVALDLVGRHELWAGKLSSYDDGDWVAVMLEDVEGEHPNLDDDATMSLLLRETERLGQVLTERVPDPPAPDPDNGGLGDLRRQFHSWADAVGRARDIPPELLPEWVRLDAATWEPLVRQLADHEVRLVNFDIRSDNLLERPTGELVFLDWGGTSLGPGWVDPLLARLERVEDPWFDVSLSSSPALVAAGDVAVDAWLVGFATMLAWRAHTAVDVNLPTLMDFRIALSRRMLAGAARRLDI